VTPQNHYERDEPDDESGELEQFEEAMKKLLDAKPADENTEPDA